MHIGFRTSGGRGEYELVGGHAGQAASGLEGWTLQLVWPDGEVRDTDLWLDPGLSGKPRLRSLSDRPFQIGRVATAFLMLPESRRAMQQAGSGSDVIVDKLFLVTKIGFGPETSFPSPPESILAYPNYIEVANQTDVGYINVTHRWRRVAEVLRRVRDFPFGLIDPLLVFDRRLKSGEPAGPQMLVSVRNIRSALRQVDRGYDGVADPLPRLERLIDIVVRDDVPLPSPDELGEEEEDVKLRSAHVYRLARIREGAARRFSVDVRVAYKHTCLFCGAKWGDIPGVVSGVDAAHILAWGKYDLDVVHNGLSLCKNHHWAFDAGVMVPVVDDGSYSIRFTQLASGIDLTSLAKLGRDGESIPDDRLPADVNQRPSARYLAKLYDDLVMAF